MRKSANDRPKNGLLRMRKGEVKQREASAPSSFCMRGKKSQSGVEMAKDAQIRANPCLRQLFCHNPTRKRWREEIGRRSVTISTLLSGKVKRAKLYPRPRSSMDRTE